MTLSSVSQLPKSDIVDFPWYLSHRHKSLPRILHFDSKLSSQLHSSLRFHLKSAAPHFSFELLIVMISKLVSWLRLPFSSNLLFWTQQVGWILKSINWIMSSLISKSFMVSHQTKDKLQYSSVGRSISSSMSSIPCYVWFIATASFSHCELAAESF